jgi:formylglycine-generating enzyme required for sulfatase activity
MMIRWSVCAGLALLAFLDSLCAGADPVLRSEQWKNDDGGFAAFAQRIEATQARNLLSRAATRTAASSPKVSSVGLLVDGQAGTRGDQGRSFIDGEPSAIAFYLGSPKAIKEVGVFSFNVDTRANQDYEVRFANNSARPGVPPRFPDQPHLTTGPKVLGPNSGGYHTWFADSQGGPLVPEKVDWIEFRIWRTYPVVADSPAHSRRATSASVVIELEVLGDERDLPTAEDLRYQQVRRSTPRQPEYIKRDTWQETIVASREAMLEWEHRQDYLGQYNLVFQAHDRRTDAAQVAQRSNARRQLAARVRNDFVDPVSQLQMRWELQAGLWAPAERQLDDWKPGRADEYAANKFRAAAPRRLAELEQILGQTTGVKSQALADVRPRLEAWLAQSRKADLRKADLTELRTRLYQISAVLDTIDMAGQVRSMRLAVEDLRETFAAGYPQAGEYLARIAAMDRKLASRWTAVLADRSPDLSALVAVREELDAARAAILLDTPLLAFDKLLMVRGTPGFAANWTGPNRLGQEMVVLSPVRPEGQVTAIHRGPVSDMDLHWDGDRILFSDGRVLQEIKPDGTGLRRVSAEDPPVTHYDGCYLPDGRIVCVSNACEQAVPCTGGGDVGNLHILDADGTHERRVTFDQDHDWNPVVMNDGRVLYTRWEYEDLPHYFSRMLFRMNPDGSGQMEYYGSNSYWPNSLYWPRPIPGHPTKVVCVVSGHHGVSRVGELVVLDPARGRHEADGAVQRIPGHGQAVEPIILDNLVGNTWPRFAAPWPLAEPGTNRGAGKYFLVCVQNDAFSNWDVCLVDVFDNITPLVKGGYMTPIPLRARPKPPVVPSQLDPRREDGVVYLADVYRGDGLRGYPRGSIKALRVGSYEYRYPGNGDTRASSYEGGWDVKKILGTVPVRDDGSALFRVPANTPIFVQPLDAEGKAQQQMRSWYVAMPGETASCAGCHERQNSGPPIYGTLAARHRPDPIQPWFGPTRGFSFEREVQPVLDRRCAGCHDGRPEIADLRAKQLHPNYADAYSPAYVELQKHVRRVGYESDNHMHAPAEFDADTSPLVQILKKGHHGVRLDRDEWDRLYTWIDLNIPYPANWRESHRPPRDEQVALRAKHQKLFAGIEDRDEEPRPLPPVAKFEPPPAEPAAPAPLALDGWPFPAAQAQAMQRKAGPASMELDLGNGVKMQFVLVPAGRFVMGDLQGFPDERAPSVVTIDRPFYLGRLEVTNQQFACFDQKHDSAYIDGRGKDRTTRGTPANLPDQPVVRVSWNEALAFCEWLSQKSGCRCTLPTEAQWEWACRAGTAAQYNFGPYQPGQKNLANVADAGMANWNFGRFEAGYQDGSQFSAPGGRYPGNAWGLADMHGNVAEWCLTRYAPYPYRTADGREDARPSGLKVVRGGSWADPLRFATSAFRWRYPAHQPVYNVGFRVLCQPKPTPAVAKSN